VTALPTLPNGFFVTLEGAEGVGKTTQQGMLVDQLERRGYDVLRIREPGGTALGERIRGLLLLRDDAMPLCPEAELLLFGASRAQLVKDTILPHLRAGGVVVCDRFIDSTTVYQGEGRGLALDFIAAMHTFCTSECTPDLTILLDVPTPLGLERVRRRDGEAAAADRFQNEATAFHERVRAGFLALSRQHPERIRTVRADGPAPVVHAAIMETVDRVLG